MLEEMIAYIELHELSILQDADKFQDLMDNWEDDYDSDEYRDLEIDDYHNTGELMATRHLLSVARDILAKTPTKGK
jgi:hypothetical protein